MKSIIFSAMALSALLTVGCGNQEHHNPLLEASDAKYGIEHYELLNPTFFREAFEKGMEEQNANIAAIVNNTEEPTFENTIAAYDQSGMLLEKVNSIFNCLSNSNTYEELQHLESEMTAKLSAHEDAISFNKELFARIKTVYDKHIGNVQGESALLDHEQMSCLKKVYREFARKGAELSGEKQEKLAALNLEIGKLQVQFSQNLLKETNGTYVTVEGRERLAGLPESNIEAAAKMAQEHGLPEGQYMFNMQRPSCNPVLQYCHDREIRKMVYLSYINRGNQDNAYDNKKISAQLVKLRLERAQLMGYTNAASLILENRMAKTPEKVYDLLDAVWAPAVAKAKEELADIRTEMKKDGLDCEPEGWDYMYYSSRAKAAKFNIDEELLSEYFEINNVLKGIFYVAERLHGLTFKEITGQVPTYDPETQVWEVYKDGALYAIFYNDYFPRDSKGAGAWMEEMRSQYYDANGNRTIPIIQNVCNMTRPNSEGFALQSADNVETMFHEFGHAMHYMLHDVHYRHTYDVERDFVELPSQVNEHWASEPEVLAVYAKHYKTGEVIPAELLQKLEESSKYGQGFATVEYVAASLVDMDLHTLTEVPEDFDVMKFEEEVLAKRGIPRQIQPRYRVTNFSHTMGGGYTAGYYSYMWAEVLDCDAFEAFLESGDIFNSELAKSFRENCLAKGGIDDGMTMYTNFRGHEPRVDALLRKRGLSAATCR